MASTLCELKSELMQEGRDMILDDADVGRIKACQPAEGDWSAEDMQTLVELRTQARSVCLAFDQLFFPAFKRHLLADGKLSQSEQFHLLRMLYGGNGIDESERRFLHELRQEPAGQTPEFETLYQQAMRD